MKIKILLIAVFLFAGVAVLNAQHVRVRLNFPSGIRIGAPDPAPFGGAIWIGPEWRWQRGNYINIPGYWAKPQRYGSTWIPGHWKYSRRGYKWVPGHWR
ncbi:MAG: YXWGXW repeat-containing protein [Chitinophagaceae bacterium]